MPRLLCSISQEPPMPACGGGWRTRADAMCDQTSRFLTSVPFLSTCCFRSVSVCLCVFMFCFSSVRLCACVCLSVCKVHVYTSLKQKLANETHTCKLTDSSKTPVRFTLQSMHIPYLIGHFNNTNISANKGHLFST